jgi:hypothetical protein
MEGSEESEMKVLAALSISDAMFLDIKVVSRALRVWIYFEEEAVEQQLME